MLLYQLRNAWRSLRRNPILSLLLVAGIALGIGVSTTFVTVHHLFSSDPLPGRSEDLYYVRIDSWDPSTPWDDDLPELPPDQLSWRDLHGLKGSGIPTGEAGMYKAALTVHPDDPSQRPFRELVRMTDGDFFPMFRAPFRYGGGWDAAADRAAYRDHMDAYVQAQKDVGRLPRPLNNLLQPMGSWLEEKEVVPEESRGLLIISLLFLLVCAVNLIGILLAKFLGRAAEVGVRRALGASRLQVFAQHLVECELIALLGGAAGLGLSLLGLRLLERLFDLAFAFDPAMVAAAVLLALAAGLVAGLSGCGWRRAPTAGR